MALSTVTPGLRALDPFTPIGHTAFGPIFPVAGGRGGAKIDFIVDDSDEDDDPFDDRDDEDDEDDEPEDREEDEPDARRRPQRIRRRDEPDEDDESDADDEDWTPPSRAEWEKVLEAQRRNNGQLMKQRLVAKVLKRLGVDSEEGLTDRLLTWGIDPETGQRFRDQQDDGGQDEQDTDEGEGDDHRRSTRTREQILSEQRRAEQRGAARAEARYKPAVALFATSAALREAGWKGSNLALGLRMIDPDKIDIEFDEAGEPIVYGLDEQIDEIKGDFPELFRAATTREGEDKPARRPRSRPGGARAVDGGERPRPQPKPATWLQRADAQLTGRTLR